MGRKKKPNPESDVPKSTDRHLQPRLTLRLPSAAGEALKAIAEAEDRTITAIVLRALRSYAQEHGYAFPGKSQDPPEPPA
jgi:hypothetical protein